MATVDDHSGLKEVGHKDKIDALARTNLFSGLSHDELDKLSSIMKMHHFPKGYKIFTEGSRGEQMYIVISGKVNISRDWGILNREMNIILSHNDFFGEMSILDDHSRSANATMLDEGILLSIDKKEFRDLVSRLPDFSIHIMSVLAGRLRKMNNDLAQLALETV
ncbi:MAG: cyclic nucleotide-binding domain-containing protein [Candidatus Eremiobacteraeota bacterium]|nr:cyclic nucleotide-binding domain-containing protein [Candidatus Eremiobacteraeota bacterium]